MRINYYCFLITLSLLSFATIGHTQIIPNGKIDSIDELSKMDTIYMPMSDGTLLATTISVPVFQDSVVTEIELSGVTYTIQVIPKNTQYIVYDADNITPDSYQLPIIFTRTPYNKNSDALGGKVFPFLGYAYAIQDMRGCYESEGVYFPMYSDSWPKIEYHPEISIPVDVTAPSEANHALRHHDGSQSILYLANEALRVADFDGDGVMDTIKYSNGSIGMFGASALGNSQYQALSDMPFTEDNPLKCLIPIVASNEHYNTTLFHNGVYRNSLTNGWIYGQITGNVDNSLNGVDNSIFNNLHSPSDYGYVDNEVLARDLIDWFVANDLGTSPSGAHPTSALRKDLDASQAPINNQGKSATNGTVSRYKNLNKPTYHLTGWWDIFINGQIETFNNTRRENPESTQKLVIGPWTHQTIGTTEVGDVVYPDNVFDILNIEIDFDPSDLINDPDIVNRIYDSELLKWYRTHLGGEPYFIIPESNLWQDLGSNKIRVPSEDYVVPYYQFLNYLGGQGQLSQVPVEIESNGVSTIIAIDMPTMDQSLITMGEPLEPISLTHFEEVKDVRMYVSGPTGDSENINVGNYWLSYDSLPFKKGITEQFYYLHKDLIADGTAPLTHEGELSYIADPNNPVITIGGNNMIPSVPGGGQKSQGSMNLANPDFKALTMDRSDVFGFISAPLSDTATFVGFPRAGIYAKGHTTTHNTAKTDFDIMVRVVDVYPDGREMLITEGTVNARAREYAKSITDRDTNELTILTNVNNNEYYYFEFDLLPLGHTFGKGHQLKFLLSSSNYPKYQSNPHLPNEDNEFFRWMPGDNTTYEYQGEVLTPQNSEITYNFNDDYPSFIMLPQLGESFYADLSIEKKTTSTMELFPNPTAEEVNVRWNTPVNGSIAVYDLTGKEMIQMDISNKETMKKINLENIGPGVYLVRIPELNLTKKLIIQ